MNIFKALYLFSALIVVSLLACEKTPEIESKETGYFTKEDMNTIEQESDSLRDISFTRTELRGMKLFMQHCNRCHPAGDKGKGPSLVDKKVLPDFLVHFQIRNGLGDMPAFKEEDLSKDDVKKIVRFVRVIRENNGQF